MSHIVVVKTEVRDAAAVRAACQRLGLPSPVQGTHRLFTSQATGLAVALPKWRYPAVCDLSTSQVQYANFREHWGEQKHLDAFLQAYAVERAKAEARRKGHQVTEAKLTDGQPRQVHSHRAKHHRPWGCLPVAWRRGHRVRLPAHILGTAPRPPGTD